MLKKQLPKQSPQSPRKPDQKPQSQTEAFQTLGLNLLSGFQDILSTPKRTEEKISRYRKFILVVSILFGILLVVNYVLDSRVELLKDRQDVLSLKVLQYFQTETDAKDTHERTLYYLHKQEEKGKLLGKTSFVFEHIDSDVNLSRVMLDGEGFSVSAKGKTPFVFTRLFAKYLEGDIVSEIVLRSANYNSHADEFRVELEGKFTK
ncbi:hypothetical protein ACFLZ4_01565 [Patescibacteria group bacterium]